jgi:hypothetical protein
MTRAGSGTDVSMPISPASTLRHLQSFHQATLRSPCCSCPPQVLAVPGRECYPPSLNQPRGLLFDTIMSHGETGDRRFLPHGVASSGDQLREKKRPRDYKRTL